MISSDLKNYNKFCQYNEIPQKKSYLETGFLYGDSVQTALELGFDHVTSIENNEKFVKHGKKRFKNELKVKIHFGDSKILIKKLFKIDQSVIF
jgi:hypothetical protein